jgi:hypothetical protein
MKYCRNIIFTNAPLLKAFRYRDLFQLIPILDSKKAPISKYARHFPAFLEYRVDAKEDDNPIFEKIIRGKGLPKELLQLSKEIPVQNRIRKEILHLMSVFTNFLFFEYSSVRGNWGIMAPFVDFIKLDPQTIERYNNQTSSWVINGYVYPGLKDDLVIEKLTDFGEYYEPVDKPMQYFTENPNLENNSQIKIPPYLDLVLDRYYSMDEALKSKIAQCIGLMYDGIELFNTKRSVSLLSIISSVEGMALIDYKMYGQTPNLHATSRTLRYLKNYVAGKSEERFKAYYSKRCDITHEGVQFLGDIDPFGDITVQDEDWRFRLEIMQAARLSLYNWIRRKL